MAVLTYKCPHCDGGLIFDPQKQAFVCEYCQSSFTETELAALSPLRQDEQAETAVPEAANAGQPESADFAAAHAMLYSCPSCGAEVVTDDTTAATFCYYCHNPVVLSGRLEGEFLPDCLIPFAISREEAVTRFLAWVGRKKFVPRAFFSKQQIERISGIYFPYWLADCDVNARMEADATRVRIWRAGDLEFTETKRFRLARGGSLHFDELTRLALEKADRRLVESVLPFDFSELKDFSMGYLSGFGAEKRDVGQQETLPPLTEDLKQYTESLLRETMNGYGAVTGSDLSASVEAVTWRYALLPVWVLTYQGHDRKTYYYAMNGQNGKVAGELPLDKLRLAALFAAVAIPLFLLLTLGGYLL